LQRVGSNPTLKVEEWRDRRDYRRKEGWSMLNWAVAFLIIGLIAGVLGLSGVAGAATEIAWILFVVFMVLFLISLVMGRREPPAV
jgi:uncharacterized membrane protein YtjA (UPF0391 family)